MYYHVVDDDVNAGLANGKNQMYPAGPASVLIGGIASPLVATNLVDFLDLIRYFLMH